MSLDTATETCKEYGESKAKGRQYLAAVLATVSAISVGTCLAWTSPANGLMKSNLNVQDSQISWISSLLTVGGFLGALPAGFIVNSLGRKQTLILIHIPMIVSWAIICLCTSLSPPSPWIVWGLYFARFLGGLAVGIISVAASMYISEVAENSIRGTLGTFYQLQLTVGILFLYIVGLINHLLIISILCGIIPFIFIATFIWMPESPVFLLSKQKKDEASKSLQWFRGPDYQIEAELNRMEDALLKSQEDQAGFQDIISDRVTLKAFIIVLGLMVFQQLSGVNAVIFYAGTIFSLSGSSIPSEYSAIIIGVVQVIATYSSSLLIEKAGRRVLLLLSDIVMAACLILLGTYFYYMKQEVYLSNWIPLFSLAIFIIVFSLGYGPIPWIIMGELVPNNLKGISSASAAGASWLLAFIVTNTFADLTKNYGEAATFWGFSIICIMGVIFVGFLLPETKGKNIDEILEELGKKPSYVTQELTKTHC